MSLTQASAVFGSIHEDALNDMLRSYFTARPRYRNFGSPALTPATTVSSTQMAAIAFPGVPGGIHWSMAFDIPKVDLFKQTASLPPQITIGPGQFALSTRVHLCVLCSHRGDEPNEPRDQPTGKRTCTELDVSALGHLDAWADGSGNGEVTLRLDQVELVDIKPDSLESVLECLIRMILDAALSTVALPLRALRAGAFNVAVTSGPTIDGDQITVLGNFVP